MNKEKYKKLITQLIADIDDDKFLKFIYNVINSFIKEWGY